MPSLSERTQLHREFNEMLASRIPAGIRFVSMFDQFLSPERGTLDPAFIPNGRGHDHHMEYAPTAGVIQPVILAQVAAGLVA